MRKWLTLANDNPSDVSVTTLKAAVSRRPQVTMRQFINTLEMTTPAGISSNNDPTVALVTKNTSRGLLIIQNDSTATVAGDVAPTFYIGFGISPTVGLALALEPGVGVVFDVRVPCDAIYCAIGPFVNTSNSVIITGMVQEGGISNPEVDTVNITETGQLAQLIGLILKQMKQAA